MHSLNSFPPSAEIVPFELCPVPSNELLLRIESPEHAAIPSRLTNLLLITLFPRGHFRTRPLCCASRSCSAGLLRKARFPSERSPSSKRRSRLPSILASLSDWHTAGALGAAIPRVRSALLLKVFEEVLAA